ncbi:hypothetical protein [Fluviicola sp.]|uniref:hypothetical protein n=1 Tax=Fluviicola sp. TaxID=1917219 RepID=UPI0031D930B1
MNDLLDEQPIIVKDTIRFQWWVILIWLAVFAIGYLFRMMHWPFHGIIRIIGSGGFMAYSLSFLILAKPRTAGIIVSNCLSLLWVLIVIWGIFFNGGYPFNAGGAGALGLAFGFLFTVHIVSLYFMKKNRA